MIKGIGCDIVENKRIKLKIAKKILTSNELIFFNDINSEKRKIEFLASRFAAKEAIIKATNNKVDMKEIEVSNLNSGKPISNILGVHLSISHEDNYSIAYAIYEEI